MENYWLKNFKRLQSIAATGIAFTKDKYDKERYEELSKIALDMLAEIAQTPIEKLESLMIAPTIESNKAHSHGYDTPKIEVRGAVFRNNEILLVQEESDQLWTLPGGYADVGLSAAENVEKEILEEAGIEVKAKHLYNLRHKAKGDFRPDIRDFYKLYFICEACNDTPVSPGLETIAAQFFGEDELPELSQGRVIKQDLLIAWDFFHSKEQKSLFD